MLATLDLRRRRASSGDTSADSSDDENEDNDVDVVERRLSAMENVDGERMSLRRISTASAATTLSLSSPVESSKVSYESPATMTPSINTSQRDRQPVDVIATYMNTPTDNRSTKSELLRSHAHFPSPRAPQTRGRSSSTQSREGSADWGWFADIDSSGDSWGGDYSWKRKLSADLDMLDGAGSVCVLGDEQANLRLTAAHKTFTISTDGKSKVVSATVSILKFRIVQARSGGDRHAQYLITLKLGKDLYADWRRYSEFGELTKKLDPERYTRTIEAWKGIDTRWFNRLEPSYLHQKCITLENFMRELMYESSDPTILIDFLGGYLATVNTRPVDPVMTRPSAQLPKEMRPPQPRHERELFEKMWEENFKRSRVKYSDDQVA